MKPPQLKVSEQCKECGKEIAAMPADEALCCACRYGPGSDRGTATRKNASPPVKTAPAGYAFERDTLVPVVHPEDIADLAGPEVDPELVERAAAVMARQESARAVGELLRHLPDVLPFVALRRVLLGSNGESGRDAAVRIGTTHPTLRRWERYLKLALRVPLEHSRNPRE